MVNKHELIVQIAKKFNSTLDRDIRPFIHMYELEHILLEALEGYTLVNTNNLKDKLRMTEKPIISTPLKDTHKKFETGLYLTLVADKDELERLPNAEDYLEGFMKNAFIETLDELKGMEIFEKKTDDFFKLMKLLEERGIDTYDKAKSYFKRKDEDAEMRMNEALDEYYNGPRHVDKREFY